MQTGPDGCRNDTDACLPSTGYVRPSKVRPDIADSSVGISETGSARTVVVRDTKSKTVTIQYNNTRAVQQAANLKANQSQFSDTDLSQDHLNP